MHFIVPFLLCLAHASPFGCTRSLAIWFQDPATPIAQASGATMMYAFLVVILTFVLWMLGRTIWHFDT